MEVVLDKTIHKEVPLTRIQRLIARRMLTSKRTKPCFYLEAKADVTELMGMRHKLSKALGVKITSNAFFIHALALAVRECPLMVGRFVSHPDGPVIEVADRVNVGFAVNTARGLIVPIIKDAERKSLAEIARDEKRLTAGARSNTLTLEDLEGETIAMSNLGAYDIDTFLGIVPPPATTILSVGKVNAGVVAIDGRATERRLVSLSLAVDHRVVDGAHAARFLQFIINELKSPEQLL
jgi:pyruvate dehydrogenase E2 component (dihydrolipoamide acetyltransferase)